MVATVVTSPHFIDHRTPSGHPECVERAEVMSAAVCRMANIQIKKPRLASRAELLRVHDETHFERVHATNSRFISLDPDTHASPKSFNTALLAAGAGLVALECSLATNGVAFALVRPPGHHAERSRAMGFCFFNNIAVAASAALANGVEKVAIVDFDVHHGNGTQQIFYDDPRVLFISIHQSPFYPWTGAVSEIGRGKGAGFNVNIPVTAGATDGDYMLLFDQAVLPILREFDSEVLLISAGYDAHLNDPIGAMRISTDGFGMMTRKLKDVAVKQSKGRMVLVTEGGYDLTALAGSLESTVASLEPARDLVPISGFTVEASGGIGTDALEKVLSVQRTYWSTL